MKPQVGETLLRMATEESQVPIQTGEALESIKSVYSDISKIKELVDSELIEDNISGVLSTPPVRNLAKQYGININDVHGTGKDGRVLKDDVLKYAIQKGIIEDPSDSTTSSKQALGGDECYSHVSAGDGWKYKDETISLR